MGCGKTSTGQELAKMLNRKFFDTDSIIQERMRMLIPEIFILKGEEFFRNLEFEILQSLCNIDNAVISTGGGAVINPDCRNIFQKEETIYLETSLIEIAKRVMQDPLRRMVIMNNSVWDSVHARISTIFSKREEFYKMCCKNKIVKTENLNPSQIAEKVASFAI